MTLSVFATGAAVYLTLCGRMENQIATSCAIGQGNYGNELINGSYAGD